MQTGPRDFRGGQANIARVASFEPFGFVHALFYRILIFVSLIYGVALVVSLFIQITEIVKSLTVIVWVLALPQVFEVAKALSLVSTHGRVFGRFSKEYTQLIHEKRHALDAVYLVLPYASAIVWIAFFFAMLVWWP